MHATIRRSLCAAVFAGGLLALGAGSATAADQSSTATPKLVSAVHTPASPPAVAAPSEALESSTLLGGLLGGVVVEALGSVHVVAPVTVPVNVSGNAVGVLGHAAASGSTTTNDDAPPAPVVPGDKYGDGQRDEQVVEQNTGGGVDRLGSFQRVAVAVQGAHVASGTESGAVHRTASERQEPRTVVPTQLAVTGSGLWPVYLSVITIVGGWGLLLALSTLNRRRVV